jgi:pyruvate formate lyase activating enzyme
MNDATHHQLTSSSNLRILENARRLAGVFEGRLVFRMPLLPGMNDSEENIRATAAFILSLGRNELNILPIHHLGREKYLLSGNTYKLPGLEMSPREKLVEIRNRFTEQGLKCYLGSETPF